ncbi:MAG: hypothetical protein SVJ22_03265 [Halobacteriota archaeon]|nr:hypothetical protein [Halobacteriota archaeon]
MKEKIENSEELRDRILSDKKLLSHLSDKISEVLKGKVKIGEDESYTFVPVVQKKPVFAPEIFGRPYNDRERIIYRPPWWWPWIGIPAPDVLIYMEKHRIKDEMIKDTDKKPLKEQILRNKELLGELSETVAGVLKEHGVVISEEVSYVFSPVVYKTPTFAHEMFMDVSCLNHEMTMASKVIAYEGPTPQPSILSAREIISEDLAKRIVMPIDGIPAPELLYALDKLRL